MLLFSILGLCGGLLCCVGDILFDLKGAGNEKLGTSKNIDSNWMRMSEWRFGASILCAFFGDAGVGFGFCSIASQISGGYPTLAMVMSILAFVGCIGCFFVHSMLCIQAVIYKRIMSKGEDNFEIADHTLEGLYKAITVPFFLSYLILMAADVCLVIAILIGALNVPKWMAALNSIVFLIIGVTLSKINPKTFQDLPGIIMPSLGLAMVGLIGIVALNI